MQSKKVMARIAYRLVFDRFVGLARWTGVIWILHQHYWQLERGSPMRPLDSACH
jgi:hypothetical protein